MKKYLITVIILIFANLVSANTLEDIVSGKYAAKAPKQMVSMPDGENYAQLIGNSIISYSYKTGQPADTLFDIENTKLNKIDTIEGFLLSPTGRYLLVYNHAEKIFRRSFKADYYIYDTQRKELVPLSERNPVVSPQFSPNGRYIAFSKENNLYLHKLDFKTEVAVTTDGSFGKIINGTPDWLYEEEFSTTCLFEFSAESKQIAFVKLNESAVNQFSWQEVLQQNQFPKESSIKYPRAGEQNAEASVVVYDIYYKSLKTMQLKDYHYIPRIKWTQSEDSLAIFTLNREQNKLQMWMFNPKSTVGSIAYNEENKNGWINYEQIDEWQFLPNNKMLVVNETSGYRHAYLYNQQGKKLKQLTTGDYDVTAVYGYDTERDMLYYQAADENPMNRNLYSVKVNKNKITKLSTTKGFHSASFSKKYNYFIDNFSSTDQPNSYILYDNQGKKVRTILENDDLLSKWNAAGFPSKQFFSFTTERGDELHGWILKPKDFDENNKYPVLQIQYSGPLSQQVINRWRPDWEYFLAEQGIVCVCVDGRGTGARGRDFAQQIYQRMGQAEAQDQVSVAKYLQQQTYIDSSRIGIWGWSFGGYMAIRAMSESDAPFKCGIAVAPVTDFRLYDSAYTERFMNRPQSNDKGYDNLSLINSADNLKGKLLIVHGLADDNVHCQNTWEYIESLVKAGKQFEMQIYPDDNHFLRKRSNYLHLYNRKWLFIKDNLLDN